MMIENEMLNIEIDSNISNLDKSLFNNIDQLLLNNLYLILRNLYLFDNYGLWFELDSDLFNELKN